MMKTKKKTTRKRVAKKRVAKKRIAIKPDALEPLEIAIDSPSLTAKFNVALQDLGKFEPKLPSGILIPALTGDPAAELPGAEAEPVRPQAAGQIQGNTIPGFNKDHQHFLFFSHPRVRRTKKWLRWNRSHYFLDGRGADMGALISRIAPPLGTEPPMCATG